MASQHSEMNEGRVSQDEIGDDALKLMFVCCHPLIPVESQVALTLKILCGFSAIEIGRALLASEAAIEKRLTRARKTLRESRIPFEIPRDAELTNRLDGVLRSLYLLFNEGYKATCGDSLIRKELCDESIRLCALLARSEAGDTPTTHALLSLMLFHAARLPGRVNEGGYVLRLKEQDRSRWDGVLMRRGMVHFARSGTGTELSEYHLEAGIAACHCAALTYKETDWRRILWFYDRLIELNGSPVIALNRAIVVGMLYGPEAGLAAVAEIQGRNRLEQQHLFHAVLGDFLARRNDPVAAASRFRTALNLVITESEREFLLRRLKECEEAASFSRERTPQ